MIRAAMRLMAMAALALMVGFAGAAGAGGKPEGERKFPAELVPPASSVLLFELGARGVQIYECTAAAGDPAVFAWAFTGPEADLLNARGEVVGDHFAGPTWRGHDGSAVMGAPLKRVDAPNPKKAIPWLLLEAKSHSGNGVFATITHIQRLDTVGGVAPKKGCDAGRVGEVARVPYTARYAFFYLAEPVA